MIIIASLLIVCFLSFLTFSEFNQTKSVIVKPPGILAEQLENRAEDPIVEEKEPIEDDVIDIATEEGEQLEADNEIEKRTITEEIKQKIREVVEGTINLFKKDLKIVAIGDSLTEGIGDETESGGYVGILNHTFEDHHANIKIENYGKKGNRTDQLLKRLDNKEIASSIAKADIILITIGANDVMKVVKDHFMNLHLELFEKEKLSYIERLRTIINKIDELNPDAQTYIIGFYNPFEEHFSEISELGMIMNDWNKASETVTEDFNNVSFIPIDDLFIESDVVLADDYFHPNTSGYKQMAKRVLESLEEISLETEIIPENLVNE
ncbi:hypothetical protein GNT69_11635 [Bacillus sp. B15-48]|nr:hypothetical protein [Bacillus sp. B15-48]